MQVEFPPGIKLSHTLTALARSCAAWKKQTNKQTFLVFLVFQALLLCRSNQLPSTAQIQDGKKLRRISDAEH